MARRTRPRDAPPPAAPRRSTGSDFGARLLVAFPAVAFALFIVLSGDWIFTAGLIALGLVCLHELFRMYDAVRPPKLAGFAGLVALTVAAQEGDQQHIVMALAATVAFTFLVSLAGPEIERRTPGISITLLGVVWVGVALAHAIMLGQLPHGDKVIIVILVGTFIGDTGAYLGGRAFGRSKLAPRISPNKTVEGLLAGMLTAVLATLAGKLYADWMDWNAALALGVTTALLAPLGDLFESQVKRDAGSKDAGTLFGAHGGALDRFDAAFFAIVGGYYVWLAFV